MIAAPFHFWKWIVQIKECQNRPSGMSVVDWYTCNGITNCIYYYLLRYVRESWLESVSHETSTQQLSQ